MRCEAMTEIEMRNHEVPTPRSISDLAQYVDSLIEREHEYGTATYAMSLAATAAFNLVASKLGVTGAMAGFAALETLRRMEHIDGPLLVIKGQDMLYPQLWPIAKLDEALNEWLPWAAEAAQKLLDKHQETGFAHVHPNVLNHWKHLVSEGRGVLPHESTG